MAEATIWGIHAGATGDADSLFMKEHVVAVGGDRFADLNQCKTRDEYKARYATAYPEDKPGAVPVQAGQLFALLEK
jgi:restriction system protein